MTAQKNDKSQSSAEDILEGRTDSSRGSNSLFSKKIIRAFFVFGMITLLSVGLAIYFYSQLSDVRENPQEVAERELNQIVGRVGELIELPDEEVPVVLRVSDPEELADHPFFTGAQEGDQVLIYPENQKAILYSPNKHKIVNVSPFLIGGAAAGTAPVTGEDIPEESEE